MTDALTLWAAQYPAAAAALAVISLPPPTDATAPGSEARVQSLIRLAAPAYGYKMFRNQVGALMDEAGRLVRFGLANDSKALNAAVKSHDLIGWRRVTVTPDMVGSTLARFTSWEIKHPGWHYTGQGRETAQMAWANLVTAGGGEARFLTDAGQVGVVP